MIYTTKNDQGYYEQNPEVWITREIQSRLALTVHGNYLSSNFVWRFAWKQHSPFVWFQVRVPLWIVCKKPLQVHIGSWWQFQEDCTNEMDATWYYGMKPKEMSDV